MILYGVAIETRMATNFMWADTLIRQERVKGDLVFIGILLSSLTMGQLIFSLVV